MLYVRTRIRSLFGNITPEDSVRSKPAERFGFMLFLLLVIGLIALGLVLLTM